ADALERTVTDGREGKRLPGPVRCVVAGQPERALLLFVSLPFSEYIHRRQRTRRVIRMARLCFAVVIVTLTMAACFHPDGIDLNFVNPGPNNYTQLTFDDQLVGDGNLSANTRYSLSGVKSGIYSIIGFNGAGFFDLQVTVY